MNTQKFIVSGIAGGVVSCLGGYLIYGMLLKDFFATHSTMPMRAPADMVWWSLIVGCIFSGLTYSYIFNRWANIVSGGKGFAAGLVLGLLWGISMDLIMYGTSNSSDLTAVGVDIICGGVLGALTGAAVGAVNGMGKKAA